jgi:hypothetical protein
MYVSQLQIRLKGILNHPIPAGDRTGLKTAVSCGRQKTSWAARCGVLHGKMEQAEERLFDCL